MSVKIGDEVKIMSFKHCGYIHRVWEKAYVVDINEDKVVVCTTKTRVHESTKRKWYTREPAIIYFYFKKWFNTIAMLRDDGIYYYTNISSPCVIENGIVKYIDYDLDVKTNKSESYKVLDTGEFYAHRYAMDYSKELSDIILTTLDEVIEIFNNKCEPFSDEMALKYYEKFKKQGYSK